MLLRSKCLWAAWVILLFSNAVRAQTTQSVTETLFWPTGGCLGFGISGGTIEFPIWPRFGDPLPTGARLRSVSFAWPLGNGHMFSWQGIPVVAFALNGTPLGGEQTIINYDACAPSYASTYTFTSDDYPDGFPGYQYGPNAANEIEMILTDTDAGVYPVGPATLTLTYDEGSSYFIQLGIDTDPAQAYTLEHTAAGAGVNASLSLGSIFAVKVIKKVPGAGGISTIVPVTSSYVISSNQVTPAPAPLTLFPGTTVVSLANNQTSGTSLEYAAVHLGQVSFTITPAGGSPIHFNLTIAKPSALGNTHNDLDTLIIDWAHKRGIPPQFVKAQVRKESNFDPFSYRYEPLSPWGDFCQITGVACMTDPLDEYNYRVTNPYARYRLLTAPDALNGSLTQGTDVISDDISPRNALWITPADFCHGHQPASGTSARPIQPSDTCVPALNIYLNNDSIHSRQRWSANNPAQAALVHNNPALLNFTAQTTIAASYGLLQILYPTAIKPMHWRNAQTNGTTAIVNPSHLFDTPVNLANGDGSLQLGTGYLVLEYNDNRDHPTFEDYDDFLDGFYEAWNLYQHSTPDCNDPLDCYGTKVRSFIPYYYPTQPNPIFQ